MSTFGEYIESEITKSDEDLLSKIENLMRGFTTTDTKLNISDFWMRIPWHPKLNYRIIWTFSQHGGGGSSQSQNWPYLIYFQTDNDSWDITAFAGDLDIRWRLLVSVDNLFRPLWNKLFSFNEKRNKGGNRFLMEAFCRDSLSATLVVLDNSIPSPLSMKSAISLAEIEGSYNKSGWNKWILQ